MNNGVSSERGGRKMLSQLVSEVWFCLTLRLSVLTMCVSPVVSQKLNGQACDQ